MKITASYALLIGTVAALLLMLTPGGAKAQSTLSTPTNLTATPGVGAVYLEWTPPPYAEFHFVAWLPVRANLADAQIHPADAAGETAITGLLPQRNYQFSVIAGRWERSTTDYVARWSGWTPWITAPALDRPLEETPTSTPGVADRIDNSSTSASATVKLTLTIGNLPRYMEAGSSIELYLEDDFQVPDTIDKSSVYFTVHNPRREATNYGLRAYATDPIEIDTDDHYGGDDDWAIQIFLPDFNTGDDFDGFQVPMAGQTLQLVFTKSAGIRNPSEAGTHNVGYSVLGPNDDANDGPQVQLGTVSTRAKISLSDEDNTRGYELTVTGTGFNNGTSATVHVLADDDVPQDLAAMVAAGGATEAQACSLILTRGQRAGIATVGSDDTVAVTFEVTVPIFKPGYQNFLCMIDGEGRRSDTDVEQFELEPFIRVSPANVSVGDMVTVHAQDYPTEGAGFTSLKIAGVVVWPRRAVNQRYPDNYVSSLAPASIGNDGSTTITFDMPGSISDIPLEGTVRIDAQWGGTITDGTMTNSGIASGGVSEDARITIIAPGQEPTPHPAQPTIAVRDGAVGEVIVDFQTGTAKTRVGWANIDEVRTAQAAGDWLAAFTFTDQSRSPYTVKRLAPGVLHAFIVGSLPNDGATVWSDWQFHMTAAAPAPTPAASPTAATIDRLSAADLPGLLPSVADIAGLATETVADNPVIKEVVLAGVCTGGADSDCTYEDVEGEGAFIADSAGFAAGYKRWSWGGGLLNVYSVAGSRAYFTLTWVSLYDTPEQARAWVDALKNYDRKALNDSIDAVIQELQLPAPTVNVISVTDTDAPALGDYAVTKDYTFSGSTAIIDGRELRFVRGRTAARAIVAGVFKRTDAASTQAMAEIIAQRIEPFMTAPTPTPQP